MWFHSMRPTVLITGASRGIGKEIAKQFAKNGYNLVLICRTKIIELDKLAYELRNDYDIDVNTYAIDFGKFEEAKELFENRIPSDGIGVIEILINNAGICHKKLFTELSSDDLMEVLNSNLVGAMLCSQYVLQGMIQRKSGKIINVSSVWGSVGASMEVAYSTSKAGLNGFTKALAKEVAPSNIQINAVACGMIDTQMNSSLTKEELEHIIEEIPANRMGTTVEVGEFIYQIAISPAYLTGQVIHFDGGWI